MMTVENEKIPSEAEKSSQLAVGNFKALTLWDNFGTFLDLKPKDGAK